MPGTHRIHTTFRKDDPVVLAEGPYQGSPGLFLRLTEDVNWAEITEHNGAVRSHPVMWLAHTASFVPGSLN